MQTHRISGPYRGYYVAAYTASVRGGFIGYGQACIARPRGTWRTQSPSDVSSSIYPEEAQALTAAEHKIRLEIEGLPPSWEPFTVPGSLIDTQKDSR
ncbi:hypothetical protein [Ramlibacter sp.]|uniref:hypothetical protein n=1 Tax=Ramlibacter sp. TaxID=1917967 RepID=UPI003D0E4ADD